MTALVGRVDSIAEADKASASDESGNMTPLVAASPVDGAAGLASTELERAMKSVAIFAHSSASTSAEINAALAFPVLRLLLQYTHFKDEEVTKLVKSVSQRVAASCNPHRVHAADVGNDLSLTSAASAPADTQGSWQHVIAVLQGVLAAESWHTRVAALKFVSKLRTRGFVGCSADVDASLVELATKRLGDRQFEVQQAAGEAMAAVGVTMSNSAAQSLLQRMRPHIVAPVPARPHASAPVAAKTKFAKCIRRRLAGCLGAAALVRSHPYSVPPYVPEALTLLGQCASEGAPVGKLVHEVVTSFRSTHADEWDTLHKHAFTPEQLNEVRDMLVSPHYFA
jgi:hypothetical protein